MVLSTSIITRESGVATKQIRQSASKGEKTVIFRNMFKRFGISLSLLTLCGLVLCGCTERTEETDTPLLSEDLDTSFQLIGDPQGSLISPEDVPVVSVEITQQDAENVWWRLKAAPAPKDEDLVILAKKARITTTSTYTSYTGLDYLVVIPKNEEHSAEFRAVPDIEAWRFRDTGQFSSRTPPPGPFGVGGVPDQCFIFVPEEDVGDYWVLNSSRDEYIPVLQGEKVWNAEQELWEWIFPAADLANCSVYRWVLYNPPGRITVFVEPPVSMIEVIVERALSLDLNNFGIQSILTSDGYVIPHGFQFSYYRVGDEAIIPNVKEELPKPDKPPDID